MPFPHQVAQLLGELDIANDGLRRTTMHNEALQAELDVNQQRVAQLERECTLLQQTIQRKKVLPCNRLNIPVVISSLVSIGSSAIPCSSRLPLRSART